MPKDLRAKRGNCILEVDSPSYPPTSEEYMQCSCEMCLKHIDDLIDDDTSFERDMSNKYPVINDEP